MLALAATPGVNRMGQATEIATPVAWGRTGETARLHVVQKGVSQGVRAPSPALCTLEALPRF